MFTVEGIRKLHGWTHTTLGVLFDHLSTIAAVDYLKVAPDFGFPTLQRQMVHILNCEGLWIQILQGREYVDHDPANYCSVAEARLLQKELNQQTDAYLATLTDKTLNEAVEIRYPDGSLVVRTPAFILHHMLTHAFHHKGQMVAMCRLLGHPAPDTDMSQIE